MNDNKQDKVKKHNIPDKHLNRIEELRKEKDKQQRQYESFMTSFHSRMHERLVIISEELGTKPDEIVEYCDEFTKVMVMKDEKPPAPPAPPALKPI